jgi:nickel superoxide dismutase
MTATTKLTTPLIAAAIALLPSRADAHCEIPCGIYDDHARIHLIEEHITTIEKSITSIQDLQKQKKINYNQLVRWIANKDAHAEKLQEIVWQYFLTQRIAAPENEDKPAEAYLVKVRLLHELLVYAMKAKQTVDQDVVQKLRSLTAEFEKAYFASSDDDTTQ